MEIAQGSSQDRGVSWSDQESATAGSSAVSEHDQYGYPGDQRRYDPWTQQYPQAHGQYTPPHGQYTQPQDQYTQPQYYPPPPPYQPSPPPRKSHPVRATLIVLASIGLAVVVGLGIGHLVWPQTTQAGNQNFGSVGAQGATNKTLDADAVAQKVSPAVVNITTELGLQGAAAAGTGIVLTADGEVLTNNHVVEGATSIKATDIGNGKTYTGTVLGYDRSHDVAVVKLSGASGLTTATLGDSSTVQIGDPILGLGNAGGKGGDPVPAPGRVSALNQSITASDESSGSSEQLTGLIQVAANIQSGDSGGPLVNADGQVIGVDTAASTGYQFNGRRGSAAAAQGFAIPINQAITLAHQIVAGTASQTVHIGQTAFMGVSVTDSQGAGAQIRSVVPDSPAAGAGLGAGDVISAIDGKPIDSATTLTTVMDTHHPGDRLTLTIGGADGGQNSVTVVPIKGPVG